MKYLLMMIILLLVGCLESEKKDSVYLQQENVQIVSPKLLFSNTIIDSVVTITAVKNSEATRIFYTVNGDEPSLNSIEYSAPIEVKKEEVYKFKSFLNGWQPSETIAVQFYKKGLAVQKLEWLTNYSDKYDGQGEKTLVNSRKASTNFGNKEWLGFDTVAVAEITFKKKKPIKSLKIGYLSDPGSWIFPPKEVTLYLTNDHITFDKIHIDVEELNEFGASQMEHLEVEIGKEYQFVKIEIKNVDNIPDWHEGKGNKAWLFMDEWLFY